ncbi:MAG: glycosyltransferase family 2 protein, partial [Spirochaetales bacterium]|nr:glycosyltransferase family 2 protein [Spirochaetales bacterium]
MNLSFSIVIPVHNRENTLIPCINSILQQTNQNFEIILVDDHSTDNSVNVIQKFTDNDDRIKLILQNEEKHGAQAARNTGIMNAQYDWIMFNDSDDIWLPNKIEKEYEFLKQYSFNPKIVIYSDCNTANVNTGEKKYWALPHISENNSYKDLLIQSAPMFQSLVCTKQHLEEIGMLDETVPSYQEWDTSIRLAKNGLFVHIQEPLFDYYIGASDAISKSVEKDFIGRCNIYNKFKDEIIKIHGKNKYKKLIAQHFVNSNQNINFCQLKSDNMFVRLYEQNLIEFFGQDYEKNIASFTKAPFIRSALRKIKNILRTIYRTIHPHKALTYQEKIKKSIKKYSSTIYFQQDGNDKIKELLVSKKPVFISRLGAVELNTLNEYRHKRQYSEQTYNSMHNNAGFFPVTQDYLNHFSEMYLDAIPNIDCCGVWFNDGEAAILKQYAPNAILVELGCLNSFLHTNPYTSILKNKKVLVIHPFIHSIKYQYNNNRSALFKDENILPIFELKILKAPQTIAGNTDGYESWFAAYDDMCHKIAHEDFDIALLGCGAYGLPLGAYIKSLGKTAIHIGGALQLLFGIKGKRWEEQYRYGETLFNEHWIYPLDEDTPPNSAA